MVRPDNILTL